MVTWFTNIFGHCSVVVVVVVVVSRRRRRPLSVRPSRRPSRRRRPSSVRASTSARRRRPSSVRPSLCLVVRPVVVVRPLSVRPAVRLNITHKTSCNIRRMGGGELHP